jgi:poly(beta-D-mannuronate) lyase
MGAVEFLIVLTVSVSGEPVSPAKILDLSAWKLTVPVDKDRDGRADEITQPELGSFVDFTAFFASKAGDAVIFRSHCGGATTKGSQYPRCELREMDHRNKGRLAAWDTDMGVHRMTTMLAITQTPPVKKHVVCAQIHDAEDDVLMVRLEGKKLLVERTSERDVLLATDYMLGTPFELTIEAADGRIRVWHNAELKMDWKLARQNCYFKAGCYTQSNTDKDAADAYGEVAIYRLRIEHPMRP